MLFHSTGDGRTGTFWHSAPGGLGLPLTCSCVLLLTPYHKTRTTLRSRRRNSLGCLLERAKPDPRAKPLPWHSRPLAIGFLTCHTPTQPLPSHSDPPPAPFPASPGRPLCLNAPSQNSSARGTPVQAQRLITEMLACQYRLSGPLWGESESLSPALPWASGAFRHPSIYSLFKSGAPGHVAGRQGWAPGWESTFYNLPGEGLGFSRMTFLACVPLIHICLQRDRAPTSAAALLTVHVSLEPGLCSSLPLSPESNPGPDPAPTIAC